MTFETQDYDLVIRSVVSTLQDFGCILEQSDEEAGIFSGTTYPSGAKICVVVRPYGDRVYVRANMQHNMQPVEDPAVYQRFYNALSQSMFLSTSLDEKQPPGVVQPEADGSGRKPATTAQTQASRQALPGQTALAAKPQNQSANTTSATQSRTRILPSTNTPAGTVSPSRLQSTSSTNRKRTVPSSDQTLPATPRKATQTP